MIDFRIKRVLTVDCYGTLIDWETGILSTLQPILMDHGVTADAKEYVSRIEPRVVLMDGRQLADYMVDLNLGVTPKAAYELKRIDSDYFVEE